MQEKYFVTQITKTEGSEVYAIATTVIDENTRPNSKDLLKEAKMLYHQILSSVYATADMEHAIVKIDNFYGTPVLMETIIPEPKPEPEPEPEEIEEGE